jgi:hypothetical protein
VRWKRTGRFRGESPRSCAMSFLASGAAGFFVLMRDLNTILPPAAARSYRRECKELSSSPSQALSDGEAAGWIRQSLIFNS